MRSTLFLSVLLAATTGQAEAQSFTIDQIRSYPFPNELAASATGDRLAWALNERGWAPVLALPSITDHSFSPARRLVTRTDVRVRTATLGRGRLARS